MRSKKNFLRWLAGICCMVSGFSVALCVGYHLILEHYIEKMQSLELPPQQLEAEEYEADVFGELLQPFCDEAGLPVLSDTTSVFHILLIGTDARTPGEPCRSDAMILISVNRQSEKIVACSLLRDTLVKIDGYAENRLNTAYSYGGTELLLSTLRENLNLEIRRYISVDFSAFTRIVDVLGGVTVTVSADEAVALNSICRQMGSGVSQIPLKTGVYHLNGEQALAYARDRSSANGDFDRTARQRALLQAILEKIKGNSVMELLVLLDTVLPYVSTNISTAEMKTLISYLPDWIGYQTVLCSVPQGSAFSFDTVRGMSVIRTDLEANISYLYEQIYT